VVHSTALSDASKKIRQQNLAALSFSAVAILICLFGNLGAIGLTGPDEPRYAWIARAMAETGDWVTPRLYGQPWFEKPVLYYWAAAAGFRAGFSAEWAARLPSAFAALLAAAAISWLAWKFFSPAKDFVRGPALFAPLLFSTSVAAVGFSRAATSDMLFSAFLTVAMAFAAAILARSRSLAPASAESPASQTGDLPALLGWGAALGLAVLAKGPAALILAAGSVALWVLATRHWRVSLRLLHPAGIAAFAVVALPWYALCAHRNPDFLAIFFWRHNVERYLTPLFQHVQPFWYFAPIFILALLPWAILLYPAARAAFLQFRAKSFAASPAFFFACWVFFPILFFSFSQSKLPGYILPSMPAAALLLGVTWSRISQSSAESPLPFRISVVGLGLTWILLAAASLLWLHRLPLYKQEDFSSALFPLAAVASLGGLLIACFGFRRRPFAFIATVALTAALVAGSAHDFFRALDPYVSARPQAALLRSSRFPDRIFTYQLPRSWDFGLAFYFHRELPEWTPADPRAALLLTTPEGFAEIKRQGRFGGTLEENYRGVLLVPVLPSSRADSPAPPR